MTSVAFERVAVIGASGGIGAAFVDNLLARPTLQHLVVTSRTPPAINDARVVALRMDPTDEDSVANAVSSVQPKLDAIIVAIGTLHGENYRPEKSWRDLSADALASVYRVNTIGPALVAKHWLPRLDRERPNVFAALSARVGSISDNRLGGWYAYRASKAALNMVLKSLAIEQARRNKLGAVVGLHPGTVDTDLSKPFQRNVPDGKLFTPTYSAERLLAVLSNVTSADSGACFAWDGRKITP